MMCWGWSTSPVLSEDTRLETNQSNVSWFWVSVCSAKAPFSLPFEARICPGNQDVVELPGLSLWTAESKYKQVPIKETVLSNNESRVSLLPGLIVSFQSLFSTTPWTQHTPSHIYCLSLSFLRLETLIVKSISSIFTPNWMPIQSVLPPLSPGLHFHWHNPVSLNPTEAVINASSTVSVFSTTFSPLS